MTFGGVHRADLKSDLCTRILQSWYYAYFLISSIVPCSMVPCCTIIIYKAPLSGSVYFSLHINKCVKSKKRRSKIVLFYVVILSNWKYHVLLSVRWTDEVHQRYTHTHKLRHTRTTNTDLTHIDSSHTDNMTFRALIVSYIFERRVADVLTLPHRLQWRARSRCALVRFLARRAPPRNGHFKRYRI